MTEPTTVSQLTLIKSFSCGSSCTVHTQLASRCFKYETSVDQTTTVQSLISQTLALLKADCPSFSSESKEYDFELFAARKSGRKVSDLPSFEPQQKILKTGESCFYLLIARREESARHKTVTISTKSIRT